MESGIPYQALYCNLEVLLLSFILQLLLADTSSSSLLVLRVLTYILAHLRISDFRHRYNIQLIN